MIPRKQKQHPPDSSQAGFTIIESLLAIIVVSVLMVGLAPVIVLSTATRVQARRVERATEAAKTYIDGVRSGAISAPTTTVGSAPTATAGSSSFLVANAPSGTLTCNTGGTYCSSPASVYCVDLDETAGCSANSPKDLVVQGFRTATTSANAETGYRLGVRVYRADAFSDTVTLKRNTSSEKVTQAAYTGGLGDRKAPLVETTTEIVTKDTNFSDWCQRLRNPSNTNSGC
ncbi:hormogonium polysaccharide secretion pseudopilin HpsB [Trichocoleus sp. DQ-A3]|uniref:hormogonium polysaccharide secretion pseudopilin HpsB n=1 Tax=Cyanophyceae TaxID=3028117 RepID=UPI001686C2FB|nr:hormogonium polysaccharide secretion pseudopilin HpsB [Coleofasciculus sp. FACHB-125]MBD1899042.1 type II secretion system protein [Coleofasciculus sp. FACHB-125]